MAVAECAVVLELSLSSMGVRIQATGALVGHRHRGLIDLGITDTGVLNHLTLRNIFLSIKSRTSRC